MDVTGYAVIGLGVFLVLVFIVAGVLRARRGKGGDDAGAPREEPTFTAPERKASKRVKREAPVVAAAAEAAVDTEPEPKKSPEHEEVPEADLTPVPATEPAAASEPGPDPDPAPEPAPDPEPNSGQASAPDTEPEPVSEPEPERDPEPTAETFPAFISAREKLDEALRAGHFSRLDVFEDYQQASEKAYGHIGPRSEYFHRVVNEAIVQRDAFESLLNDEDRERFVAFHSRYLDDVSVEADPGDRERMHLEQIQLLRELRPRAE